MKRLLVVLIAVVLGGCVAHMTPYGVSIEPLADIYVVGPPVVAPSPPAVTIQPLPPVVVVPDRRVYSYGGNYYYFWGDAWYWGRDRRGPWHSLPRDRWPSRMERRDSPGGGGEGASGARPKRDPIRSSGNPALSSPGEVGHAMSVMLVLAIVGCSDRTPRSGRAAARPSPLGPAGDHVKDHVNTGSLPSLGFSAGSVYFGDLCWHRRRDCRLQRHLHGPSDTTTFTDYTIRGTTVRPSTATSAWKTPGR
jgi:hypothetical protein